MYTKKNAGCTVHCRVSVDDPQDCVSDWELWLTAAAQHDERVSREYHTSYFLAWEKIKLKSSKCDFQLNVHCFHTIRKVKKIVS